MRRLAIAWILVLVLVVTGVWLVLPMFLFPSESSLDDCTRCAELIAYAPEGASIVLVMPRGGTTLFELGRRIVPGPELRKVLPAPGLLAIGLGDAPVVGWRDVDGRIGAVAAPSTARSLLLRIATIRYGGDRLGWRDGGLLAIGEVVDAPSESFGIDDFAELRGRRGHCFATHDLPKGESVARLTSGSLEIATLPEASGDAPLRRASHPRAAALSLAVPDVAAVLEPVDKLLPLKIGDWKGRAGQVVIFGVDSSGLLPSIHGLLVVEGEFDPRAVLARNVPFIEGATTDVSRVVDGVEVVRRETMGVVVEAASKDGALAVAFDGSSMERWLSATMDADEQAAVWSFASDPALLSASVDGLVESPGSRLLKSSARRTLRRLGEVVGGFRNAARIHSARVEGSPGSEIRTRVDW